MNDNLKAVLKTLLSTYGVSCDDVNDVISELQYEQFNKSCSEAFASAIIEDMSVNMSANKTTPKLDALKMFHMSVVRDIMKETINIDKMRASLDGRIEAFFELSNLTDFAHLDELANDLGDFVNVKHYNDECCKLLLEKYNIKLN